MTNKIFSLFVEENERLFCSRQMQICIAFLCFPSLHYDINTTILIELPAFENVV